MQVMLSRPPCLLPKISLNQYKRCFSVSSLPPFDSRNRFWSSTEEKVKNITSKAEKEKVETQRKKIAMQSGCVATLSGLGLATYTHFSMIMTPDNLSLSLVTLGSAMLLFSMKDHEIFTNLMSREKDEDDDKAVFTFKLLNEKNKFSKEIKNLADICPVAKSKWPEEVQAKLGTIQSKDVETYERELSEQRKAMIDRLSSIENSSSASEAISYLSPKLFVLDYYDPDPLQNTRRKRQRQSRAERFGEEVSLLLSCCTKYDTVLVNLQSPGGAVSEFGLAASHLLRLKRAGIHTIVTVDKVAASGGFMMACCANEIVAAPFSFIGSIGVIAEMPNVSKVLSKNDVDWHMFTAGKFKRTITVFSENTEEGLEKFQSEIEAIHNAFKEHVHQNRGDVLDIEQVATGEAWLAMQCKKYGLVDRLATSWDVMQEHSNKGYDVIKVLRRERKDDPFTKFFGRVSTIGDDIIDRISGGLWGGTPKSMISHLDRASTSVHSHDNIATVDPNSAAARACYRD